MTQLNTDAGKPASDISIYCRETDETNSLDQHTTSRVPCLTHGPSKTPLLDRELLRPQVQEIVHALSAAVNKLADEKGCTECAVEHLSTILTDRVRYLRTLKQTREWSKEDRKAMKAEAKGLLKPFKKQLKSLWKAH